MNGYAYDDWTVPLASQVVLEAFRSIVSDEDDDYEVPIGRLFAELADELGIDSSDIDHEWVSTAGEIRQRTRSALNQLAVEASNTESRPEG